MRLKSFNYFLGLLLILFYSPAVSEEKIDIWKNKKETVINSSEKENKDSQNKLNLESSQTIEAIEKIKIEDGSSFQTIKKFLEFMNPQIMISA